MEKKKMRKKNEKELEKYGSLLYIFINILKDLLTHLDLRPKQ